MTETAWQAFEYEVLMFHETRARLRKPSSDGSSDDILRNALVESSLLHTRVLVDALLGRQDKPDDVTLNRLLPASASSSDLQVSLCRLTQAYGTSDQQGKPCWTLNKRLAHLTRVRGNRFDYSALYATLDPIVGETLREVARIAGRPLMSHYCA